MKLTDPEIIEARKRALENNPRSYKPWYEILAFGHEIEKTVMTKYWHRAPLLPAEEGWYVVVAEASLSRIEQQIFVTTLFWSNQRHVFSTQPGEDSHQNKVLAFKKINEFIEDAGLEEPGSLALQGIEDGEKKNDSE